MHGVIGLGRRRRLRRRAAGVSWRRTSPLDGVATNAALMLHADGVPDDEARAYVMQWALTSEQRATT